MKSPYDIILLSQCRSRPRPVRLPPANAYLIIRGVAAMAFFLADVAIGVYFVAVVRLTRCGRSGSERQES